MQVMRIPGLRLAQAARGLGTLRLSIDQLQETPAAFIARDGHQGAPMQQCQGLDTSMSDGLGLQHQDAPHQLLQAGSLLSKLQLPIPLTPSQPAQSAMPVGTHSHVCVQHGARHHARAHALHSRSFSATPGAGTPPSPTTPQQQSQQPKADGGVPAGGEAGPALDESLRYTPSRFLRFHREVLYREMLLKAGDPGPHWYRIPRLEAIELRISAQADTKLSGVDVERRDLLLHQLALEHVAAGARAEFIKSSGRRGSTLASGVRVQLVGSAALDFLEKLIYVVLPNQISFEGLGPAKYGDPDAILFRTRHLRGKGSAHHKRYRLYTLQLKVDSLLLYPDFEHNFEMFSSLKGMQVVLLVSAPSPDMARLYLAGFGLPLKRLDAEDSE